MNSSGEETEQSRDCAHHAPDARSLPDDDLHPDLQPPAQDAARRALFVMAKQPVAGRAKTRLVPPLTSNSAASLYHCFLQDILATVRVAAQQEAFIPGIAYTPAAARDFFRQLAPDFLLIPQQGPPSATAAPRPEAASGSLSGVPQQLPLVRHPERLGDILQYVLSAALSRGHRQVAAINSDSPTLPPDLLCSAFRRLDDPRVDAVFGPCADGGYYLIGVKRPPGRLVTDVQMSTPTVLRDTLAIAAAEGLRVDLLPEWYDIDSADELKRLSVELTSHPERAPATSRFLTTQWTSTSSSQL